jgi:protein arginine kinase
MGCLSALRFGLETKLLTQFTVAQLNKALLLSQPGHLQRHTRERLQPEERDQRRAQLLREVLGCNP